eukprot:TRINITY_DN4514_c0_g1_i3.p1 TRINITY_DN4514_c0_g1~~TRINITY_DN4514_c0_g1_i3.p1  ORF type:complete len:302 (+),score=64.83 TRINITY_DN4514_c0_g1_i3:612-1517(+)
MPNAAASARGLLGHAGPAGAHRRGFLVDGVGEPQQGDRDAVQLRREGRGVYHPPPGCRLLIANSQNKSVRYWPTVTEPVLNCGPFVVRLVRSYSFEADTVCTELSITNGQESTEPRTIMHYQFTGWADHCVLASSLPIRRLIRKVSEDAGDAGGPPLRFPRNTVVHCSAGIGRSGTFCAIHVALQKLHRLLAEEEEGTQSADNTQLALLATEMLRAVNVCAIVKELRRQRCGMVQGLEQYTFCHYAVQDELTELGILRAPYCCFLGTARCASGTTAHPPCSMHHEHEEDTNSKTDSPPEER